MKKNNYLRGILGSINRALFFCEKNYLLIKLHYLMKFSFDILSYNIDIIYKLCYSIISLKE